MKLVNKGAYYNGAQGLNFPEAGIIEVDAHIAEFLLKDAPENFAVVEYPVVLEGTAPPSAAPETETPEAPEAKALDEAPKNTAIKAAPKKK